MVQIFLNSTVKYKKVTDKYMKIKKIIIENKSFKDETKNEFNDDFNILIEPNGSGKSNLLDILTIF